jgi:uncharacterized protein YndB with AHSA1/START domain
MVLLRATRELDIPAPPERLYDLLAPERTPDWDRSIVAVSEIHGPLGAGARYRETHRILLRAHAIDLEVTDYEPPVRIAYRTVNGGPPSTSEYELLAGPELTTVRVSGEAQIAGLLIPLAPLLRRVMRRQLIATLRALENYCKTQRRLSAPS